MEESNTITTVQTNFPEVEVLLEESIEGCDYRVISISTVVQHAASEPSPVLQSLRVLLDALIDGTEFIFTFKLLVDRSQVGYVVGKNGVVIKNIIAKSNAGVEIESRTELPPCAWVSEEVVRMTGDKQSILEALNLVVEQLLLHPPKRSTKGCRTPPLTVAQAHQQEYYCFPGFLEGNTVTSSNMSSYAEVTFRLLSPMSRIGSLLGKSGEHIQRLRGETGASIKVYDPSSSDQRLITFSSIDEGISPYCAAQDALIRAVLCMYEGFQSETESVMKVKLLAESASIGVLLGKKGATISQLRKETGAFIRVQPMVYSFDISGSAVQIEGSLSQCIHALKGVATLLRSWQIRQPATPMHSDSGRSMDSILTSPTVLPPPSQAALCVTQQVPVPLTGSEQIVTLTYRLTNFQVGALLGKGGSHIAKIRQLTGAKLLLASEPDSGGRRSLIIEGPMSRAQHAHSLVNYYLATGRCPPAYPIY